MEAELTRSRIVLPYLVAAALAVLLKVPAFSQTQGVTETKLPNGLTVLMKEVHSAPVFTAQVWFRVGSRNEHTGITGISHMLEHMLFNSSRNYKKGEITAQVRERGGLDNAATWTDFTYYWELLSSEHLDFALKTLAERMGNALLLADEFENERKIVLSELKGNQNDIARQLYYALSTAAFDAHPYHWPVIGWQSDVENVSVEDLRNYYKANYIPGNATLVLVGDFDSAKALGLVRKYFGRKKAGSPVKPVYTTEPPQRGERRVTLRRDGSAARVLIGYHIPELTHPDTYALMLLDQILSGGRSSRLYQALVEAQIASSAWSSAGSRTDPSLFSLGAIGQGDATCEKLEAALLEQAEVAKTTVPTAGEMQAALNQIEASIVYQNDSVSDQGQQLGYYNTVASWRYLDTVLEQLGAVKPEDVTAVAQKYLTRDNMTSAWFIPTVPKPSDSGSPGGGADPLQRYGSEDDARTAVREMSFDSGLSKAPNAVASVRKGALRSAPSRPLPTRTVLDNGIVLIVMENHSNPTAAVLISSRAGSCFEEPDKTGLASLTAQMLTRGAGERDSLQFAMDAEFVGAEIGSSADVEDARMTARCLSKDLPLVMDLLADALRSPALAQDQLDRVRMQAIAALERTSESPEAVASRAFRASVFPAGHAYHAVTIDQAKAALNSVTREDVAEFHRRFYRPDTMVIVVVGDVDPATALAAAQDRFGDWKADGPAPNVEIATVATQTEPKTIKVPMPDKSESDLIFGYALGLKRTDPDFYAFRILNQILGGGGALGSVLGKEIREKRGLAYSVYSTFDATLGAGPWYAALGTSPKNVDLAVQTLKEEVSKLRDTGATKEQVRKATEFIVGIFPIALETNRGVANALMSAEKYGLGMDYLNEYAEYYRSVTVDQVNVAARKYLRPDTATLVVAGPEK